MPVVIPCIQRFEINQFTGYLELFMDNGTIHTVNLKLALDQYAHQSIQPMIHSLIRTEIPKYIETYMAQRKVKLDSFLLENGVAENHTMI